MAANEQSSENYILRLHPQGKKTELDWHTCNPYDETTVSEITSPTGETAKTEITSIPSPLARIALVKDAFAKVASNLDGNTIYHKMVSYSLDVAEIFFNYEKFKKHFIIEKWDIIRDLEKIAEINKYLYNAIRTYIDGDGRAYNLNKINTIYILRFNPQSVSTTQIRFPVVGATSPASLFLTPANDLSYVAEAVTLGTHSPFSATEDGKFLPLYERDAEFIKYFYLLKESHEHFSVEFPEVNRYLEIVFPKLSPELQNQIRNLSPENIGLYNPLKINGTNDSVEIIKGFKYHVRPIPKVIDCDFTINSRLYNPIDQKLPLVLPSKEAGSEYGNWKYVQSEFGRINKAPFRDKDPWRERTLPNDGTQYPYLTITDFLEDTILYCEHKAYDDNFYYANWNEKEKSSILLPLKPLFFEFFTVEQLQNDNLLTIKRINKGAFEVNLKIPTKKGFISYSRGYYEDSEVDDKTEKGAIAKLDSQFFGLLMFPMVRTNKPFYRIAITHAFNDINNYELECYHSGRKINIKKDFVRNKNDKDYAKTQIYAIDNSPMDYFRIGIQHKYGVAIPLWKTTGNEKFIFAVDFGTTNTHIEYCCGAQGEITPFKDEQLAFWTDSGEGIDNILESDLIPIRIGERFKFPARTALSEAKEMNWDQPVDPMVQTNLALVYGHRRELDYNTITTDLKWSDEQRNSDKVEQYIQNLMLLMRNKVLLSNGRLEDTKIIWFYPESMPQNRLDNYMDSWKNNYKKYFGDNEANISYTIESIAPYELFRDKETTTSRMVSIDIGGGTTDVVFASNGEITHTTSFRFAADSIFGDAYSKDGNINGLVASYIEKYNNLLSSNGLSDLNYILDKLKEKSHISTGLASFFFSLKNDDEVIKKRACDRLDWNGMLRSDNRFKILFLLFYSAIIYHIAHIMHACELDFPRHIAFSGNGSRVLSVLTPNIETLSEYTKKIFCSVYSKEYHPDGLDIIMNDNPKTVTCKGGIKMVRNNNVNVNHGQKVILKNAKDDTLFIPRKEVINPGKEEYYDSYNNISDDLKNETINDVIEFIKSTLSDSIYLKNNFGIEKDAINKVLSLNGKDFMTFTVKGINRIMQDNNDDSPIVETLFFYPLIGMMHEIARIL